MATGDFAERRMHNGSMEDGPRDALLERARDLLESSRGQDCTTTDAADRTVRLATLLASLCEMNASEREVEQAEVLSRLMLDKRGQIFTTLLTDRAYRSNSKKRAVEQARYLLELLGAPEYVGRYERWGLQALRSIGTWLPTLSGTAMLDRLREESSAFILPADEQLGEYLERRREQGADVNINHLGEEVLGEAEAQRRIDNYVRLLERRGIDTLSVKISSIHSQLGALDFDANVRSLVDRLGRIFSAANANSDDEGRPKLVMLDMEAFRDAELTMEAFKRTLELPEFRDCRAGIALQTYLPHTSHWHQDLLSWAERRRESGGTPIRTRIVKGANLAMERVESALHGWQVPTYLSKAEVDAHFKHVLLRACQPRFTCSARVGIGSHNLFDVSFALLLRAANEVESDVVIELLEGMAGPLLTTLRQLDIPLLLYSPIVSEDEFPSAIAYLARRLDENTAPENYLPHSFSMTPESAAWNDQESQFRDAHAAAQSVSTEPRARHTESAGIRSLDTAFVNESDTDFASSSCRSRLYDWFERVKGAEYAVASVVAGTETATPMRVAGVDPSRPGHEPYTITLASASDVRTALSVAADRFAHPAAPAEQRQQWLLRAAGALREARHELIALMALDAGKRAEESDVEVSEAIDFAEYYARSQAELERDASLSLRPKGPVVVTPPWNFPLAIPLGGVFAALVAGNPVILKPALETPLVAQRACQLLWSAGIPKDVLQFLVCDDEVATELITSPTTRVVVLTGATSTARTFLDLRPDLELFAETGGKNGMYVSAMSDHEQAILDIVGSAFGHSGQKCSALSQLVLDRELYESETFMANLADATLSLRVGSAWDLGSVVTPLIAPPSPLQREALSELRRGESWLVQPRFDASNPRLVSPGIKLGVAPGSPAQQTEYFCPLLSVLCADDVAQGVEILNNTRYGLTAGIHSLDEREQELFIQRIEAGNVYVNRRITGAVVRRQPFGGWKESSFGPGAKAGGPNYVAQFNHIEPRSTALPKPMSEEHSGSQVRPPKRVERLLSRITSQLSPDAATRLAKLAGEFMQAHTRWYASAFDASNVRGEDNWLRYRPLDALFVICSERCDAEFLAQVALCASVAACPLEVYAHEGASDATLAIARVLDATPFRDEEDLLRALELTRAERVRSDQPLSPALSERTRQRGMHVMVSPLLPHGRLGLLEVLREQSVCVRYHRYGHLGLRSLAGPASLPPSRR